MRVKPKFPLLAKMLLWLLVHFALLAGAFAVFVGWQLSLGLDSLLSGAAGDRLKTLGDAVASDLRASPRDEWPAIVDRHVAPYGLQAMVVLSRRRELVGDELELPSDIEKLLEEANREQRPPRTQMRPPLDQGNPEEGARRPPQGLRRSPSEGAAGDRPPHREGPQEGRVNGPPPGGPPDRLQELVEDPSVRPVFLNRSDDGGYWAAVDLPLFNPRLERPLHGMLVLRSNDAAAAGLFFDLKPWVFGGLAVLSLSLVLWAPFVVGITRYVSRLSRATEQIALGNFETKIKGVRWDELGNLGHSIENMAQQLDRLVRGQKRFLGDVAHELCSPLARIRTGLGVMEHGLDPSHKERLDSIEEDVAELSDLVAEVLAFTKASTAPNSVKPEPVELLPLLEQEAERECPEHEVEWRVADDIKVLVDRRLFSRAVANVLRNAHRHGGKDCELHIYAKTKGRQVELMIADNGPGVGPGVVSRLFEPFFRPDEARNREAGGAGLGMAIVRTAVEACGGSVSGRRVDPRGLAIILLIPAA